MSKRVLIISASPRKNSNSEALAASFAKGAKESGNQVEMMSLREKSVNFCHGCNACQKNGVCVIKDDAGKINEKMMSSDVIVFATPIYFGEMIGQLKTVIDRTNPLCVMDYAFRDIYMLTSASDPNSCVPERAVAGLKGWIESFENSRLAGTVFAGGVTDIGEINGHHALVEAYEMGKRL